MIHFFFYYIAGLQLIFVFFHFRIDPKSYATYRGKKFKKSDILASNRNLKFDGMALMQSRGKMIQVVVVVLTDVLFFLHCKSKCVKKKKRKLYKLENIKKIIYTTFIL